MSITSTILPTIVPTITKTVGEEVSGADPIDPTTIASIWSYHTGNNVGGNYNTWVDESGKGHTITMSPNNAITFSGGIGSCINGDENCWYQTLLTSFTAGEIFFRVKNFEAPVAVNRGIMGIGPSGYDYYPYNATQAIINYFGCADQKYIAPYPVDPTDWHTYNVYSAPNDHGTYVNGELLKHFATNTVNFGGYAKILTAQYMSPFKGYIKAIALFNAKLSDEDRAGVTAWFNSL